MRPNARSVRSNLNMWKMWCYVSNCQNLGDKTVGNLFKGWIIQIKNIDPHALRIVQISIKEKHSSNQDISWYPMPPSALHTVPKVPHGWLPNGQRCGFPMIGVYRARLHWGILRVITANMTTHYFQGYLKHTQPVRKDLSLSLSLFFLSLSLFQFSRHRWCNPQRVHAVPPLHMMASGTPWWHIPHSSQII